MITILVICTLLIIAVIAIIAIGIGGGALIIVFGDVIVFVLVMIWIFKKLFKKKDRA